MVRFSDCWSLYQHTQAGASTSHNVNICAALLDDGSVPAPISVLGGIPFNEDTSPNHWIRALFVRRDNNTPTSIRHGADLVRGENVGVGQARTVEIRLQRMTRDRGQVPPAGCGGVEFHHPKVVAARMRLQNDALPSSRLLDSRRIELVDEPTSLKFIDEGRIGYICFLERPRIRVF
jgi:hypothetical protein